MLARPEGTAWCFNWDSSGHWPAHFVHGGLIVPASCPTGADQSSRRVQWDNTMRQPGVEDMQDGRAVQPSGALFRECEEAAKTECCRTLAADFSITQIKALHFTRIHTRGCADAHARLRARVRHALFWPARHKGQLRALHR